MFGIPSRTGPMALEKREQESFHLDFLGRRDRTISCELHYA